MLNSEVGTIAYLDIHGLNIECRSESPVLTFDLIRPFKYFLRENGSSPIQIFAKEEHPPYENFPSIPASFVTPRNVVYRDGVRKIIDYFGKGVVLEENGLYTIYSSDRNLLSEIFYLLILSLLGQFCDRHGFLRIHALGLSHNNKAILVMLPQGGGKSTMAFHMLGEPEVRYISDDDPIVDPAGRILPFPRPLGCLDSSRLKNIPEQYVYSVDRMEFGVKHYVDCDYWGDRIENRPLNEVLLLIGKRMLNGTPTIKPTGKTKILRTLFRDAVVGVGLYQGLEFLLNHSSWDALSKIPVLTKRFFRALRLARTSKGYEFTISNNPEQNSLALKTFLNQTQDKTFSNTSKLPQA